MTAGLSQQLRAGLATAAMPRLTGRLLVLGSQQLAATLATLAEHNPLLEVSEPGRLPHAPGNGPTLAEHLAEQLARTPMTDRRRADALRCLGGLDDRGYLPDDASLAALAALPAKRAAAAGRTIRQLSPVGAGARSLAECLLLQLDALDRQGPEVKLARRLVAEHADGLRRHQLANIAPEPQLEAALAVLRSLQPRFANAFARAAPAVLPELEVRKAAGVWQVRLAEQPHVRVSDDAQLLRGASSEWRRLRREARHLVGALEFRRATLLKVAQAIVDHQRAFFFAGSAALLPLGLRQIAAQVGLGLSTVAASVADKHFAHAGRVFALKFLLQRNTCKSRPLAAAALHEMIKQCVAHETPASPLTDQHLMRLLHEQGYQLARRTVAKHRAAANVMPSFFRKHPSSGTWMSQ